MTPNGIPTSPVDTSDYSVMGFSERAFDEWRVDSQKVPILFIEHRENFGSNGHS